MSDLVKLFDVIDGLIAANQDKVEQAMKKSSLTYWFVGKVMSAMNGEANAKAVTRLLDTIFEVKYLTAALTDSEARKETALEALIPFANEAHSRPWLEINLNAPIGGSSLTNQHLLVAMKAHRALIEKEQK